MAGDRVTASADSTSRLTVQGPAAKTVMRRSRSRRIGAIYVAVCLAVLFAPIAVLVLFSFNGGTSISLPFRGFSLRWYEEVVRDPNAREAFGNSLLIAAIVTPICVILGLVSAYSVARLPQVWRGWGLGLLSLPLVVPWLVIGIAALIYFHSLNVEPSLATVVVMQVVVTFPLVTMILYAALIGMGPNIEDAGFDLGCVPPRSAAPRRAPAVAGATRARDPVRLHRIPGQLRRDVLFGGIRPDGADLGV